MKIKLILAVMAFTMAGCVSFDGRGLVPGQATTKDVEALMGVPADRIKLPGGDIILFYPRQPMGRMTYAARMSPDGVLRSVDQLLAEQNLKNLSPGVTSSAQAREILGPPWRTTRLDRLQRDVWEYTMFNATQDPYFLYVQMSSDGVVREVMMLKDYVNEPGGDSFP